MEDTKQAESSSAADRQPNVFNVNAEIAASRDATPVRSTATQDRVLNLNQLDGTIEASQIRQAEQQSTLGAFGLTSPTIAGMNQVQSLELTDLDATTDKLINKNQAGREMSPERNRFKRNLIKDEPKQRSEDGVVAMRASIQSEKSITEEDKNKLQFVIDMFRLDEPVDVLAHNKPQTSEELFMQQPYITNGAYFFHKDIKDRSKRLVIYDRNSCCCLSHESKLRQWLVWLVCSPIFDNFIIFIITLNSLQLAAMDYEDRENLTQKNKVLDKFGFAFTIIFIIEAFLKISAMSFIVHRNSYLRDGWNILDFVVVLVGIVELLPFLPKTNLRALRTLRVLRPLRSINAFPSMKKLVSSLLEALPQLGSAVFFMFIIFLIFSILGTQQFQGVFYQRCRFDSQPAQSTDGNLFWPSDLEIDRTCSADGAGNFLCPDDRTCGHPFQFPDMRVSKQNDGVMDDPGSNYGIAVFDNMILGFVTVFQMVTLEGWSDIMYTLMDASQPQVAIIFCCLVVIFGSFFLLNVVLAVIMEAFEDVDKNAQISEARRRKEYKWLLRYYKIEDSEVSESESENDEKNKSSNSNAQMDKSKSSVKAEDAEEMKIMNEHEQQPTPTLNMPKLPKPQMHNPSAVAALDDLNKVVPKATLVMDNEEDVNGYGDQSTPSRARKNLLYYVCYCTQDSNLFSTTMVLAIIANTLILSLDRYPISESEASALEIINEVMTYTFLIEMIIMITGLGPNEYARDSFNLFDAFVVVLSIVELIIKKAGVAFTNGAFSALRAVRLLRVFKLARKWTSFRELLEKMSDTLGEIKYFAVLVLLFMFIETLLGMELFAFKIKYNNHDKEQVVGIDEEGVAPRPNFNSVLKGFTTIFIVFIGENWNESMYDHTRVLGNGCIIYFIQLFILGNIVLLNLFLAILLQNFEEPPGKSEEEQALDREDAKVKQTGIVSLMRDYVCCCLPFGSESDVNIQAIGPLDPAPALPVISQAPQGQDAIRLNSQQIKATTNDAQNATMKEEQTPPPSKLNSIEPAAPGIENDANSKCEVSPEKKSLTKKTTLKLSWKKLGNAEVLMTKKSSFSLGSIKQQEELKSQMDTRKPIKLTGNVFGVFSPENSFRKLCAAIVGHQHFEGFIIALILVSTVLLIFENPLSDPNGTKAKVLYAFDIVMTTLFSLEMILKVMVLGFIFNGKQSYLLDSWCQLDFLIVIISIINLSMADADLAFLKILRLVRVLRPLRMVSRNPGLRIAVMSILYALPPIKNVLVVSLLFVLLFAILFTTFFKGLFYSCDLTHIPEAIQGNILDKFECLDYGGDWKNRDQNFDNVMSAMTTLFNVMTTEGWIGVMYDGIDSTKIDMMPQLDSNPYFCLFFFFYMFVGSLFVLNMFVGVTINVFNKEKEQLQLDHLLTPIQVEWCDVLISIYKMKPQKKYVETGNYFRDLCNAIASSQLLDQIIFLCILLNTIVLGLSWYGQAQETINVCEMLNLIFNVIYTFEAAIKLFALGWDYFNDGWNNFDFLIVFAGWVGTITNNIEGLNIGAFMTVLRAFRIGRIFKIVKKYRDLKVLFYTFIGAIPQLTYVGGLLFLLLFIYAILGVQLFADVQLQEALNVHANFKSFGTALLTLFRMSTGESWHELMYDATRLAQYDFDCYDQTYEEMLELGGGKEPVPMGCGKPVQAVIYFLSFMVIMSFVFLNLFIAIILENFNIQNDAADMKVTQDTLEAFNLTWLRFDPTGKGFINVMQITQLIDALLEEEVAQVRHYQKQMELGQIDDSEEIRTAFLFNLHQDKDLQNVFAHKVDQARKKAEQKADSEELKEGGANESNFDLPDLQYSDEELTSTFMTAEERNRRAKWKRLRRLYNKFTAKLQIPCYKNLSYFYYYDVLEAVSRVLFQIDLEVTSSLWKEHEDGESIQASLSISEADLNNDPLKSDDDSDEQSEEIDHRKAIENVAKEHNRDIRIGELEFILQKLESKGAKNNILKYKQMSELRASVNQKVRTMLDLTIQKSEVMDSSHVIGGLFIKKFLKRRRQAVAREKLQQQEANNGSNIEPIPEAARDESEGSSNKVRQAVQNSTSPVVEDTRPQQQIQAQRSANEVASPQRPRVVPSNLSSPRISKKGNRMTEVPGNNQDGSRPMLSNEESKQQSSRDVRAAARQDSNIISSETQSQAQLLQLQPAEDQQSRREELKAASPDSQAAVEIQGRIRVSQDSGPLNNGKPAGL